MTLTPAVSLNFAAATDIGCKRTNNEDSFGYDAEQHIYVVCDGMGGNAAGEVASGMAVRALIETFEAQSSGSADGGPSAPIEERLLNSIVEANRIVQDAAEGNPELHTMGTTLVRSGTCLQVTLDHSLLDEQVRSGLLTQEEAAASPLQSVITRAIGIAEAVEPDLFAVDLHAGDMLLLTTDGLTRYAQPDDIARIASPEADLASICNGLIDHAKQGGGVDNITCMMLRVVEIATAPAPEQVELSPPSIEL